MLHMTQVIAIHATKQPQRIHYIAELAKARELKQADIIRLFPGDQGVNKSTVSRWFKGHLPQEKHLYTLAAILQVASVNDLFRDPADDWLTRLLRNAAPAEKRSIAQLIETSLSLRTGTGG